MLAMVSEKPWKTALRLAASLAIASSVTLMAQRFDERRGLQHVTEVSLRGARQVAAQVEALYLEARESQQEDPLGRALYDFAQSPEPRFAEVRRLEAELPAGALEFGEFDREHGIFEYAKSFEATPATGDAPAGVRVRVLAWRPGYFGARTTLQNDLTLAATFLLTLLGGLFCFRFRSRVVVRVKEIELPPVAVTPPAPPPALGAPAPRPRRATAKGLAALQQKLMEWRQSARASLLQTGGHVRDVVRSAHELTASAQVSLEKLVAVQAKFHGELTALHGSRLTAEAISRALNECEGQPEKLARVASQLRAIAERNAQTLQRLEREMEPWSTEIDLAVHSFDDFAAASDRMRGHIRQTTEAMLEQARLVKEMELETAPAQEVKSAGGGEPARSVA